MNRIRIYIAVFFFFGLAVSAFSQNTVSLDVGLRNSVRYFEGRLPNGTKLAVLNLSSPSPSLAEYVIEEIIGYLVNSNSLTLVERGMDLNFLQQEMNYQFSGEVSDETVLSIGVQLGAQTIVTGSINLTDDIFRLRIRAIDVQTAVIQGQFNVNIRDRYLLSLYNTDASPAVPDTTQPSRESSTPGQRPVQPGNGGGRIRLPDYLQN
jgi:TolB-like protein